MSPIWSLLMALVLLSSCAAAAPSDNTDDMLEDLINPGHKSVQPQSRTLDSSDLLTNVTNALSTINQQVEIVKNALDALMKRREKDETTTSKPVVEVNEKSCGVDKVCVKKGECKSENTNADGRYKITYRALLGDNTCNYLETCCHKDDKTEIKWRRDDRFVECGVPHIHGVNMTLDETPDNEAQFGEFGWMVAIMLVTEGGDPEYIGGGSIIAPNVILTSASKVNKIDKNELVVRAGEWDQKTKAEMYPHMDRKVNQVIIHDKFSCDNRKYNIALLVLERRFSSMPHISSICLPSSSDSFDTSACIVTGWGKKSETSSDYSHILKKITLPVLPRETCDAQLKGHVLDPTSICAGGEKDVDSCKGDGGSPLVCPMKEHPNRYYQVGIVGWGLGCGLENVPGVYTNVPYLYSWIDQELKKLNIEKN